MCTGSDKGKTENADLIEAGNIDLLSRPKVKNPDGSYSTVYSMGVGIENGYTMNIPRVVNGKVVSEEEAKRFSRETGQHLGIYRTEGAAKKAAELLHNDQADLYGK
jgi:hypothetical protein